MHVHLCRTSGFMGIIYTLHQRTLLAGPVRIFVSLTIGCLRDRQLQISGISTEIDDQSGNSIELV